MEDTRNKHRRPDRIQRKFYFSPDVIDLIEEEAAKTGFPRNIVLEILIREKFGRPPVEEAMAVIPSPQKPVKRSIDIFKG